LDAPERPDDRENDVRTAVVTPMEWSVVPTFKKRFGIDTVFQLYGQSEVPTRILIAPDDGTDWKQGSLGRAVPWLDVRIVDEHDRELADGEIGEIVARPNEPFVMYDGYLGAPELTLAGTRNLWHHTGDLAIREPDGQFIFAGRKPAPSVGIDAAGVLRGIEVLASGHPDVMEAAAYSLPMQGSTDMGTTVVVAARRGSILTAEDLAAYLGSRVGPGVALHYVGVLDELPHNAQYKVDVSSLVKMGVFAGMFTVSAGRAGQGHD
jgi:crotonobetaine/carnitine-CoA ligase